MTNKTLVHFKYPDQGSLCRAMIRMQEFYESPYPNIRGRVFTIEQYAREYTKTHGAFTYYEDWNGFNIPGHVLNEFFQSYHGHMDPVEWELYSFLKARRIVGELDQFYLIATHPDQPEIEHETCHAMWYLDPDYRLRAEQTVEHFRSVKGVEAEVLEDWLLKEGYTVSVINDEFNAYLATTDLTWWQEKFGDDMGFKLWCYGARFRLLVGDWVEPVTMTVPMENVK